MTYTVVHQGATKNSAYQTYAQLLTRQLLRRGVNLDRLPRVKEEGAGKVWLYVWESREEASAFAEELKEQTHDPHWHVQPVRAEPSLGPLRPLQINVGRQRAGWTFALEPLTRKAIQARFPGSCHLRNVFVGSETEGDFPASRRELRDLAEQVLFILTGLKAEQLQTFESFRVVDPVDGQELVLPSPLSLSAG